MNYITALAQRMKEIDPRDEFEKLFPLPVFCIRCGTGYASTSYNGWKASDHIARWEGWKAAMALMESRTVTVKLPPEFSTIGENIRTQDNRITSDPIFCVYQKREITVDADCIYDRIVWVDEDGNEANKRQSARLELLHENCREPNGKWRRVAVKEIDDFVTCCFTENGCKDYLASNGHNLRLPFIYVKSGFRNAEYIGLRNWLAGIQVIEGEGQ